MSRKMAGIPRSVHLMHIRARQIWGSSDLVYHGGPIQRRPGVYLVLWHWTADPNGEAPYLTSFLEHFGGSAWYDTVTQYYASREGNIKKSKNELLGTWRDPSSVPLVPEYADVSQEALKAVAHFGFDTNASYIIASPVGHDPDGFGFAYCAYHDIVQSAHGQAVYMNLPYMPDAGGACGANAVNDGTAGYLDGVSIVAGHELAESETDPQLDAWYDDFGQEIGDKCAWQGLANVQMSRRTFAVQPLWSNNTNAGNGGCVLASKQV